MGFAILLIAVVAAAILVSVAFFRKAKWAERQAKVESALKASMEEKLNTLRRDISATKEELAKKNKLLDEARDVAKKKLRKEAIKSAQESEAEQEEESTESARLKRALQAMEAQLRSFQGESERALERTRHESKEHFEKELDGYRAEINKLNQELGRKTGEAAKKKQALAVANPSINIESLSDDVVSEVSRLMRKTEHLEKLNGVAQGKLQMAQERYAEMQKRYFAVCRELAVAAGKDNQINDQEARHLAEEIINASESETESKPVHSNGVTS